MGKELIPLKKEVDSMEFMKDHKGQFILRYRNSLAVDGTGPKTEHICHYLHPLKGYDRKNKLKAQVR